MVRCKDFCVPATNITLRQRLRAFIGRRISVTHKTRGVFQGFLRTVGTTFLVMTLGETTRRVRLRISNIIHYDLQEVGPPVGNRLAVVRTKFSVKTSVFVRVGKDFVEFISMDPQDEQQVTFFFREMVPCSQMRGIECIFNKCKVNGNHSNRRCKCKCRKR